MTRPAAIVVAPTCPHCGNPMQGGQAAIACFPNGKAMTLPLPPTCNDPDCHRARDEAAIARGIASGLIRDASNDPPVLPCPECEQGKHPNCDGTTWDYAKDEPTACPCDAAGHR